MKKRLFALAIGCMLALVLGEVVLHLYPSSLNNWNSKVRYTPEPDLGYKLEPNGEFHFRQPCFDNKDIHTNSLGFRDSEWDSTKGPKIALLGDSFLEALQVGDNQHTGAVLERMMGTQVLSAGISGFGTAGELLIFKKYLKKYKPELVVVLFYPKNDPINNHCKLNESTGNSFFVSCPCLSYSDPVPEREQTITWEISDKTPEDRPFFQKILLLQLLKKWLGQETETAYANSWGIYQKPLTGEWLEAATFTGAAIRQLKQEVDSYGGKLQFTLLPDMDLFYSPENLRKELGWEVLPKGFNPNFPYEWVSDTLKAQGISFIDLRIPFSFYANTHKLKEPWFYFACNSHFNPIGHWLAARCITGWASGDSTLMAKFPNGILPESELPENVNPTIILGE